jgi:hypothetical protein
MHGLRVRISSRDDDDEGGSVSSYWYRTDSPTYWDPFLYLLSEKLYRTKIKPVIWWLLCVQREKAPKPSKMLIRKLEIDFSQLDHQPW